MKLFSKNRGYTLLFATLTAAVVLSVAIFISTVARKQYILASTARDSMFAIYNADSAIECAAVPVFDFTAAGGSFYCNDILYNVTFSGNEMSDPPSSEWGETYESNPVPVFFYDDAEDPDNTSRGCAVVTFLVSDDGLKRQINSRGYNLGKGSTCPTIGPRTVERAMRVTYGDD